ncbi:MAG: DUF4230 domain-containing protein [Limisphaerales bacterium]
MHKRFAVLFLMLAAAFLIGSLVGVFITRWRAPRDSVKLYNTATLLQQAQSLNELVTVKYVIERVVVLEDVKWYGENRVLLLAHGVVKAGVDLGRLQPADLTVSSNRLTIKLPPARIFDAYLDEQRTQVIERTTGLLRAFDKNLEQNVRRNAVDDIQRAARMGGILKDADRQAREQLERLFRGAGFAEVEFQ